MVRRFGGLVCLVGLACAGRAAADELRLRDGSVRTGTIVAESRDLIVVEVVRDGVAQTEQILRANVEHITWGGRRQPAAVPASQPETLARRQHDARRVGTAGAYYELGLWCARKNFHQAAAAALQSAADMDPGLTADALSQAAESLLAIGRVDEARRVLIEVVRTDPTQHRAAIALGNLDAESSSRAATLVALAVERFQKAEHARSISTLARIAALDRAPQRADAERRLREATGLSLAELIVENRFRAGCSTCRRETDLRAGLVNCPTCKGRGDSPVGRNLPRERAPAGMPPQPAGAGREPCKTCRGFTYIFCPTCRGAGFDFGVIGPTEREAMAARLRNELDQRWPVNLEALATGQEELLAPLVEDILMTCRTLQYFRGVLDAARARPVGPALEESRRKDELLRRLSERADAAYERRTLETYSAADRIHLEKALLDQDAFGGEVADETDAVAPETRPADAETRPARDQPPFRP